MQLANLHGDLARALLELERYEEATSAGLMALSLASDMMPDRYRFHAQLGSIYVHRKAFDVARLSYLEAIEQCERRLNEAKEGADSETLNECARTLAQTYKSLARDLYAEGLTYANRALDALDDVSDKEIPNETESAIRDTRGWIYYHQCKYDEAKADLECAMELAVGNAERHTHLALLYERLAEGGPGGPSWKRGARERWEALWNQRAREQWEAARDTDRDGKWERLSVEHLARLVVPKTRGAASGGADRPPWAG